MWPKTSCLSSSRLLRGSRNAKKKQKKSSYHLFLFFEVDVAVLIEIKHFITHFLGPAKRGGKDHLGGSPLNFSTTEELEFVRCKMQL